MDPIVIVATSPCYITSLGAMSDAHARLGEAFESNDALGSFSKMATRLHLVGAVPGPVRMAGGKELTADLMLKQVEKPRLVYLPNFQQPNLDSFVEMRGQFQHLHKWLRQKAEMGVVIAACGTSVLHLAAAGLADHIACAASPRLTSVLRMLAPRMRVDTDAAIRHEGRIWTCSRDADNPAFAARLLADIFSMELGRNLAMREPPGPAAEILSVPVDPVVARAQLWIRDRFTRRFRIADLANELGLSHQTLIRHFAASGASCPRQFVQKTRVEAAASMLVETNRSVTEIAQLVGYADIPSFRRVFQAMTGTAPLAYRASMRALRARNA